MALYLGNDRAKIHLDKVLYVLNLYTESPMTNGNILYSYDNYMLKDINGLFLTVKEDE